MAAIVAVVVACSDPPDVVHPSARTPLPLHRTYELDTTPKQRRRMVQPEVLVRAYLQWFGGLAPLAMQARAPQGLFDQWKDYLAALGLPNYKIDLPRAAQSNTIMVATLGKLAEALCVHAVDHDLVAAPPMPQRSIFAFEEKPNLSVDEFRPRFDVLHRTFLSYPAELAPPGRTEKFYALYQSVATDHAGSAALAADRAAWAAVCTALVLHPETGLY